MPPRASLRRSVRVSSREPEQDPSNLQMPNLPALQGTPSSRRQYSYGAAVEPLGGTRRPGRRREQPADLGSAVQNALERQSRQQEEEEPEKPGPRSRASRSRSRAEDAEEDELAAEDSARQPAARSTPATRRAKAAVRKPKELSHTPAVDPRQPVSESEADDTRSFGMESVVYGDASIRSTPDVSSDNGSSRANERAGAASVAKRAGRARGAELPGLSAVPEERGNAESGDTSSRLRGNNIPKEKLYFGATEPSPAPPSNRRSRRAAPERGESDEDEPEHTGRQAQLQHKSKTNTPAPVRFQQSSEQGQVPPATGPAASQVKPEPSGRRQARKPTAAFEAPRLAEPSGQALNASQNLRSFNVVSGNTSRPSLFRQAANPAAGDDSFRPLARYPSDHSDLDAAIQRDIQEAEEQVARDRRESEAEARKERLRQMLAWLGSLSPVAFLKARFHDLGREDGGNDEFLNDGSINWWRLLAPGTYLEALKWLPGAAIRAPSALRQRLMHGFRPSRYIIFGLLVLLVGLGLFNSSDPLAGLQGWMPDTSVEGARTSFWPDLSHLSSTIGQHIPSVTWPLRSHWGDSGLWELDEDGHVQVEDFLRRYEQEFSKLMKGGKLQGESLKRLESVVPKVVHMQLKDGKPVVSPEFWHALRDLIREDDGILTTRKQGGTHEFTSEKQWQAIVARLVKEPKFAAGLNASVAGVEARLDKKMASSWTTWVEKNDDKIAKVLGPSLERLQSVGSKQDIERSLGKIVKEHLQGSDVQGIVVTRDEYLRHLKNEFATHRAEIKAELKELQPRLEQLVRDSVSAATKEAPDSMTRAEVTALVNDVVRKAVGDANLEAAARGSIHAHWDTTLKNQVNYFGLGAGATIDAKHSSTSYDPHKKGVISDEAFKKGLRGARPYPHVAALLPWSEEGECWCAARSINHRGNPHGASLSVQLGHQVIPQHLVVEHILPGATTDPDARPRDLELYAHIADASVRARVRDFAATHFPDDESDWNFTPAVFPERFVKIGRLPYASADLHDGVHAHWSLSTELVDLGAETDQVIVRAISNHGATDHTCFYRVKLYGRRAGMEVVDVNGGQGAETAGEGRSWLASWLGG